MKHNANRALMEDFRECRKNHGISRERLHYNSFERFSIFLASAFSVRAICRIKAMHLEVYVDYLRDKGYGLDEIKKRLSDILFYLNIFLPANSILIHSQDLGLQKQEAILHRSEINEIDAAIEILVTKAQDKIRDECWVSVIMARHLGMRVWEAVRLKTETISTANQHHAIKVKSKDGYIRQIPIPNAVIPVFSLLLSAAEAEEECDCYNGYYLCRFFTPHNTILQIQQFIRTAKVGCYGFLPGGRLTYSAIRYACACEKYWQLTDSGASHTAAISAICDFLGQGDCRSTEHYLHTMDEG